MSAAEVVEKAKAAGIDLSAGLVYAVRHDAKSKGGQRSARVGRVAAGGGSLDAVVRDIVREEIRAFFAAK